MWVRSRAELEPDVTGLARDAYEESSYVEEYFWSPISVKLNARADST